LEYGIGRMIENGLLKNPELEIVRGMRLEFLGVIVHPAFERTGLPNVYLVRRRRDGHRSEIDARYYQINAARTHDVALFARHQIDILAHKFEVSIERRFVLTGQRLALKSGKYLFMPHRY
jgi:hypothetical protein